MSLDPTSSGAQAMLKEECMGSAWWGSTPEGRRRDGAGVSQTARVCHVNEHKNSEGDVSQESGGEEEEDGRE